MGNALRETKTQRGKTVFGGLIAAGVIAGGIWLNGLSTDGEEKKNDPFPAFLPMVIDVAATGSTTVNYDGFCVRSPLYALGNGSGTIIRAEHHNISNPAAASMDIGFVEDCNDLTSTGQTLFSNTCTGTGCIDYYTTGTLAWQGSGSGRYLKGTVKKDPLASYDAKVVIWIADILGE